jgi:hypothetical protein
MGTVTGSSVETKGPFRIFCSYFKEGGRKLIEELAFESIRLFLLSAHD